MANTEKDVIEIGSEKKITKGDLVNMFIRSNFHEASLNFERMQALGFCFEMVPIIKRLYKTKEEKRSALKRHLEFFNTHPYAAAPVLGVTAAVEEQKANGAPIDDAAVNSIKVGLMGPLAGVGDPLFWGTLRPIFAALGASLAISGSILGPIVFILGFNIVRLAIRWYGIKYGYKVGTNIIKDMAGNRIQKLTEGASVLGLFVMGALVSKWTSVNIPVEVSRIKMQTGQIKITTVQSILDQLMPGLVPLILTFICMKLLKKKVSPTLIIFGLFAVGIVGYGLGILK